MDLPLGAITGGTKLALQVVSQRRRPVLEIYSNLRNRARPPETYKTKGLQGKEEELTLHGSDTFVEFTLANIGALRAENVSLTLEGDYTLFHGLKRLSSIGYFRGSLIPQLAPAQSFHLFHIDTSDLEARGPDGKVSGMSKEHFTINVLYNGPKTMLGKLRRKKYRMSFSFLPGLYEGALLPPREYR